jgi:ribosomal-protein-alanine N-acetyltransferase
MNIPRLFKDRSRPYVQSEPEAMDELRIRWMIRSDMPEVLDIESASFPHPWDEATFINCLRQRNCIGMVVEQKDRVVGYMIYEMHKNRLHVLNLAVSTESRRQGVGTAMVAKLISKLRLGRQSIFAEVSEWNDAGIFFLRDCGFWCTAVAHGQYENGTDAYVFRFRKEFAE